MEKGSFYSMFSVGQYTVSSYKVIWGRIASEIAGSVIGSQDGKSILPQETITLVSFNEMPEAHYFCAVINSSIFNFAAQSYCMRGGKSFGSPQLLENIYIPKFKHDDIIHIKLSKLSQRAHTAATNNDDHELKQTEEEIDQYAAKLWGLNEHELKDIRKSLIELEGSKNVKSTD